MGAAGAFAPVNLQQRVHCTRPEEELSYKWPFFSLKRTFLVQKIHAISDYKKRLYKKRLVDVQKLRNGN